jgi:hypothetical protein
VHILLDTSVIIDLADVELGVYESAEPAVRAISITGLAVTPVLGGWICRSPRPLRRTPYLSSLATSVVSRAWNGYSTSSWCDAPASVCAITDGGARTRRTSWYR